MTEGAASPHPGDPEPAEHAAEPRTVDGRVPGKRGRATRSKLLSVTEQLLQTRSYRDLTVVEIAREAGVSPATFYQYFPDVEAAVLVLADDLVARGADLLTALVAEIGPAERPLDATRSVAAAYLELWEENRAVLRVIDLAAGEGDARFRDRRTRLLAAPTDALGAVIAARCGDQASPAGRPEVVAGVMTAMLAHVAAHRQGLADWGASTSELVDTMARVLAWTIGEEGGGLRQLGVGSAGTAKAS